MPGAQEDLSVAQHGLNCSELLRLNRDVVARNLSIKDRQKACFVITGRGWNSSELTSPPRSLHNTRLPFQQSHHPRFPRSSRSLSSAQKYLTYYSPPCLRWLSTLHPVGMPCISGVVTLVALPFVLGVYLYSLHSEMTCCTVQRCWVRALYMHVLCMSLWSTVHCPPLKQSCL